MIARIVWSCRLGDGRVATLCEGDEIPQWQDGTPLTNQEQIDVGFKQHPSIEIYVQAVKQLGLLWESIPEHYRIRAEYGTHRIEIPHDEWAKNHAVWC